MCGRYTLTRGLVEVTDRFDALPLPEELRYVPRYNAAPTQQLPIVIPAAPDADYLEPPLGLHAGAKLALAPTSEQVLNGDSPVAGAEASSTPAVSVPRRLVLAQWGYIPPWSTERISKFSTFNAMAEKLADSKLWSKPYRRPQAGSCGRCLVPLDGFYEWRKVAGGKQPLWIRRPDGRPFALAGLYGTWRDHGSGGGRPPTLRTDASQAAQPQAAVQLNSTDGVDASLQDAQGRRPAAAATDIISFTIVTCPPSAFMADIHHRMGVILAPEDEATWLDPATPPEVCDALLKPYTGELVAEPVSTLVNSARNDVPACIESLTA